MRADPRRVVVVALWLLALTALAAFAWHSLRITTDLRSFMPPPQTPDQKLLMEQIGEGPGSRLLLLAIELALVVSVFVVLGRAIGQVRAFPRAADAAAPHPPALHRNNGAAS